MLALVTGAAGFIGSHLCLRLLEEGYAVRGVDCFTGYYHRRIKERNLRELWGRPRFSFIEADLADRPEELLQGVELVFHQAAQPGVRASWGDEFSCYLQHNLLATQRLLEAARRRPPQRLVYASSSSVYGAALTLPTSEEVLPRPISPYGVTKLAAEHLCCVYAREFAVPAVSLRYFTVYGPGQRPDMAFHRFIRAALLGEEITIYGDGEQTRDFTFVADAVEANLAAAREPGAVGRVYNIGGGCRASVNGVLRHLEKLVHRPLNLVHRPAQAGDPLHTCADTRRARQELSFKPRISLEQGLVLQVQSVRELLAEE